MNKQNKRYKKGEHPAYDKTYQKFNQDSFVLSNRTGWDIKNAHRQNWDKNITQAKINLYQLVGDAAGNYKEGNQTKKARMAIAKEEYKNIKAKFKRWSKQQVRIGNTLNPPTDENRNYPKDLLNKKLKAEALLDIRTLEKVTLEQKIEELKEGKDQAHKEAILPSGPMGRVAIGQHRQNKGDLLKVDRQFVSHSENGIPFIDDEASPYNRMAVVHYRKMSEEWKDRNKLNPKQLLRRKVAYNEKLTDEYPDIGYFPIRKFKMALHGEMDWPKDIKPKNSTWPSYPKWPKFAKKIDELNAEPA